jgi:hypothetical protein
MIKGSSDLFEYDNEIEIFLNISKSKLYLKKLDNKNQNISFKKNLREALNKINQK